MSPSPSPSEADGSKQSLRLTLLGAFSASVAGKDIRLATRKAQALLALLALGDPAGESRGRAVALLWGAMDGRRSASALQRAVTDINRTLLAAGFAGFRPGEQVLFLDRALVSTDLEALRQGVAEGRIDERLLATRSIADTLLANLENVDPVFRLWLRARRYLLHEQLIMTLESKLTDASASGDAEVIEALLSLDPTHEAGCRHLMRARAFRGEIGGALEAYKALWDALERGYGVEPLKETQDLVVEIKQQVGWSARPGDLPDPRLANGVVSLPTRPVRHRPPLSVIAVDAFDVGSIADGSRSIVSGFRRELAARLARVQELSVQISAAGAGAQARGAAPPVQYVLGATAYERPDGLHLMATLRDGQANTVWSDRVGLQADRLLTSQRSMVRAVAGALGISFSADRQRRSSARADLDGAHYGRWLRAQDHIASLTAADWRAANDALQELIGQAPDFPPLAASLARLGNVKHIVLPGHLKSTAELDASLRLARRAVELDPLDPHIQLSAAWAQLLAGNTEAARLHADMAGDLGPNDPPTLMGTAWTLACCGDHQRAVTLCAQSLALAFHPHPLQRLFATAIFFLARRPQDSIEVAGAELGPLSAFSIFPCASLIELGRADEAKVRFERLCRTIKATWSLPTPPAADVVARWLLGAFPLAVEGDWERLRQCLATAGAAVADLRYADR